MSEYLAMHLPDNPSEQQLKEAKQRYRKEYLQNYYRKYKQSVTRLQVVLPIQLKKQLDRQVKADGVTIRAFVQQAIQQYLSGEYTAIHSQQQRFIILQCYDVIEELIYDKPELEEVLSELQCLLEELEQL